MAMVWLSVAEGTLLVYTMPIWATLLAWPLRGARPKVYDLAALVLGLTGIGVLLAGFDFALGAGKLPGPRALLDLVGQARQRPVRTVERRASASVIGQRMPISFENPAGRVLVKPAMKIPISWVQWAWEPLLPATSKRPSRPHFQPWQCTPRVLLGCLGSTHIGCV